MKNLILVVLLSLSVLQAQEAPTWESVVDTRTLWPKEVTVNIGHEVPIMVGGKPSGSMQVPAGRIYPVKNLTAKGVLVDAMGSTMTFSEADTDLLSRVEAIQVRQAAKAAATPAPTTQVANASPTPKKDSPPPAPEISNVLAAKLKGDLVTVDGRKFEKFDAAALNGKKYLGIYFSAGWCPPCRTFTPKLVKWYKRKKSKLDLFDIIFVSSDKTEEAMQAYMKDYKMAWPALAFGKKSANPLRKFKGRGIPCLVILDAKGEVLSHSYEGENYVGPTKVLKAFDKLLKGG